MRARLNQLLFANLAKWRPLRVAPRRCLPIADHQRTRNPLMPSTIHSKHLSGSDVRRNHVQIRCVVQRCWISCRILPGVRAKIASDGEAFGSGYIGFAPQCRIYDIAIPELPASSCTSIVLHRNPDRSCRFRLMRCHSGQPTMNAHQESE